MENQQLKTVWIDARHPMGNQQLWGLTLLERNIREMDKMGFEEAVVLAAADDSPSQHFCHRLPDSISVSFVKAGTGNDYQSLIGLLGSSAAPVLVLSGNALNDRRVISELISLPSPYAALAPSGDFKPAAAACFTKNEAAFIEANKGLELDAIVKKGLEEGLFPGFDFAAFDPYIKSLRREIPPYLIKVETQSDYGDANRYLKLTVHKGTNDFVAKYIHPPFEFGITKLLATTPVIPNHVTFLGIALSATTVYCFATGQVLLGAVLAATKGILDGVDGKLARFLLKYSKFGDLLDHVSDTIFDALWYLALGWFFSQGDWSSPAACYTMILFVSYWVERIVPGLFKKVHKYEIYDFSPIDRFSRLIGSRMNNNVWVLLIATLFGYAQPAFYFISIWMLVTAAWHTFRFAYVTLFKVERKN
ncbi:MAG TPA: CDP-alcohol phosphatidyltransferase family protein [Bacteroidetes bacterium]|nr:CDP-alcohol phosphatidyltransferase family protein [Bacteroidota bacterium]